jgi:molybdopterin molybdotransferase
MITVKEAFDAVMNTQLNLRVQEVFLHEAVGRKLAQHIIIDHDLPPFDRVMMDGLGIHASAWAAGQREFTISGIQKAGDVQQVLTKPTEALEVMTGAVVPIGINVVIPYEDLMIHGNVASVKSTEIKVNQNIHLRGSDRRSGTVVASAGSFISPSIIGIAASAGCSKLRVYIPPKIAVIATGNELVAVDQVPLPHQIRMSNSHALAALVKPFATQIDLFHINDHAQEVEDQLRECLLAYDVVLLSGGVSKGKFDLLPQVLNRLGIEEIFHRVQQKPGKPFWFGKNESTVVFAFPGNPVSTLFCAYRYLLPWLMREASGLVHRTELLPLESAYSSKNGWTHFVPMVIRSTADGLYSAEVRAGQGSGDFAHLEGVDGFVEVSTAQAGDAVPFYPIR